MKICLRSTAFRLLFLLLIQFTSLALAVPPPAVALKEMVTDLSGTIPAESLVYLVSTIAEDEKADGLRVRVVLIGSSTPEPIDDYAERLMVAQPLTNAPDALLVIEPGAQTGRIVVRPEYRQRLSPMTARVILRESVFCYLRDGNPFSAVEQGARRMHEALRGKPVQGTSTLATAEQAMKPDTRGMVRIPPFAPVVDLTGTLAPNDISGLTSDIEALRLRKGVQVAILMLPGVKPETIEQFALRTFESWKPGRKGEDNGVLIVVAKDQRRMRIEVGYGLEGVITDLVAGRIIGERVTPLFRKNDFSGGLMAGLEGISRVLSLEQPPTAKPVDSGMPSSSDLWITVVIVILGMAAGFRIPLSLSALLTALVTGTVIWHNNGPGTAIFLGCFSGAITFMLPGALLGIGRSSSGSSGSGSSGNGSGGGNSGGGGASGGW